MQATKNTEISAVILASGTGRRMNNPDKGLLPLAGQPLMAHVLQRLTPQVDEIFLNCDEHTEACQQFGYPLVSDALPGKLGPLAGLLAAMQTSDKAYVLSVPCDTPWLPEDLIPRMFATLQQNTADLCSVSDGERLHPVILLARRSTKKSLHEYLLQGGRKVRDWFYSQNHCITDFSDQADAFRNINTIEELQTAESEMTQVLSK